MAQYQYRVVPFIGQVTTGLGQVTTGLFTKQDAQTVSSQLQAVIDENVRAGWEFSALGNVSIEVKPGCLGTLLGAKVSYVNYDQVIFRRAA